MQNMKYFKWSMLFTLLGLIGGFYIDGWRGLGIVGILAVLETSLSFDNAVVNAKVLKNMSAFWRKLFLTVGIVIAVFGMRILFPLLIVATVADLGMGAVIDLALNDQKEYARVLTSAHHEIAAFGGAFLMMVFLSFFADQEKDHHWLHWLEAPLSRMGSMKLLSGGLTLVALMVSGSFFEDAAHQTQFVFAGVWGLVAYILTVSLGDLLGADEGESGVAVAKSGFASFMYLEVLDASFSFDGVIGAFALSTNLFIIAIGLGVGALFVRSFTLLLVDKGTLTEYQFLEHGAFWAIGVLAAVMMIGVHMHIPEAFTGLSGAILIGLALYSSVRAKNHSPVEAA